MSGKKYSIGHRGFVWNRQGYCRTAVGAGIWSLRNHAETCSDRREGRASHT